MEWKRKRRKRKEKEGKVEGEMRVRLRENEEGKNIREKGEMGRVTGYGLVPPFIYFYFFIINNKG